MGMGHVDDTDRSAMEEPQENFEKLLRTFYGMKYDIPRGHTQLDDLARVADFYMALPSLSASLDTILLNQRCRFTVTISQFPREILGVALKLRHTKLFKECLIHTVGIMASKNQYVQYAENDQVDKLLKQKFHELKSMICDALTGLDNFRSSLQTSQLSPTEVETADVIIKGLKVKYFDPSNPDYAGRAFFFRKMFNTPVFYNHYYQERLQLFLTPLMRCELQLRVDGDAVAGRGRYSDRFLCTKLFRTEIPWAQAES